MSDLRINSRGQLEIPHPETESYVLAIAPLPVVTGFPIALIPSQMDDLNQISQQLEVLSQISEKLSHIDQLVNP